MLARPDKEAVLEAIARFVETDVKPALADPALAYRAILVSEQALQSDQGQKYVYVVSDEGKRLSIRSLGRQGTRKLCQPPVLAKASG